MRAVLGHCRVTGELRTKFLALSASEPESDPFNVGTSSSGDILKKSRSHPGQLRTLGITQKNVPTNRSVVYYSRTIRTLYWILWAYSSYRDQPVEG